MLKTPIQDAIERFDKACQEYAVGGLMSDMASNRVVREYKDARRNLDDAIGRALRTTYKHGEDDGYGRAQIRPGFGDMGG